MAFTIPLSSVAGTLAVSFTVAAPDEVPIQSPSSSPTEDAPALPEPEPPALPDPEPPALPEAPEQAQPAPSLDPPAPPSRPATAIEPAPLPSIEADERPEPAPAKPRLMRPTDKRGFFSLSVGGATATSPYALYYGGSSVGFATEMMVGRRGKRHPNLGGAFVMQYRKSGITEVSLAGRFLARKQLTKAFALYTTFDSTLGISIPVAFAGYVSPMIPSAQLGIGWGLEAILAERVSLGFRPFAPSIVAPNYFGFPVALRWEFGVSMGIVW